MNKYKYILSEITRLKYKSKETEKRTNITKGCANPNYFNF